MKWKNSIPAKNRKSGSHRKPATSIDRIPLCRERITNSEELYRYKKLLYDMARSECPFMEQPEKKTDHQKGDIKHKTGETLS